MHKKILSDRLFEMDALRIIAIFAVIMVHIATSFVFRNPYSLLDHSVGNFLMSVSKFSVPFFLMSSGYFMLHEEKKLSASILRYKISKLFLILVFWSFLYALYFPINNFLKTFILGYYHLWYLYAFIGLYIMTPVLRLCTKKENKNVLYYACGICILFTSCPKLLFFLPKDLYISEFSHKFLVPVNSILMYYLLGYLIRIDFDRLRKFKISLYITLFLSLCVSILGVQFFTSSKREAEEIFYSSSSLPLILYSVSLFILLLDFIQNNKQKYSEFLQQKISALASLILGVYLIHAAVLRVFRSTFLNLNTVCYIPVVWLVVTVLSFLITYLISKIKYLKWLIKI